MKKIVKLFEFVVLFGLMLSIALTFMFSANLMHASAMGMEERSEKKTYCEATLEDDFSDDKVIIVLNKEATRKFITYKPKDFSEVNCIAIDDLTKFTVGWVQKQIYGEKTEEKMLVNIEKFRRILSLELKDKSKENVLKAVKVLEKRGDVISANPNIKQTISAQPNDAMITDQWALSKISAPSAWDIYSGNNTVKVGVLDTGIDGIIRI